MYIHTYIHTYDTYVWYHTYVSVKSLSHLLSDFFFKKIYEVICIINLKNTLFKGFTRGDPWVPPLFKQDVKTRSKHSGEDVIYGMGGLIRT